MIAKVATLQKKNRLERLAFIKARHQRLFLEPHTDASDDITEPFKMEEEFDFPTSE